MSNELLAIKQERIPVLRNQVIQADRQNRWYMGEWASGLVESDHPETHDFASESRRTDSCGTAFCGAGWGAQNAGYKPALVQIDKKRFVVSSLYVPVTEKGVFNNRAELEAYHDAGNGKAPSAIAQEYYGLTGKERHFLFRTASRVTEIDRYAAMLDVVKDGNPSDFEWLYKILLGEVDVPKAELIKV